MGEKSGSNFGKGGTHCKLLWAGKENSGSGLLALRVEGAVFSGEEIAGIRDPVAGSYFSVPSKPSTEFIMF